MSEIKTKTFRFVLCKKSQKLKKCIISTQFISNYYKTQKNSPIILIKIVDILPPFSSSCAKLSNTIDS